MNRQVLETGSASGGRSQIDGPPTQAAYQRRADDLRRTADRFLAALAAEFRHRPASLGFLPAIHGTGRRLVDVLDAITMQGVAAVEGVREAPAGDRIDEFVTRFADEVAGPPGLVVNAVIRKAAAQSAERLVRGSPTLEHAIREGGGGAGSISDELFCAIYQAFFADAVTELLRAIIAAKLNIALSHLGFVDPTGQIVDLVAEEITDKIPTPCSERDDRGAAESVADVGRSLVVETVERALGIATEASP